MKICERLLERYFSIANGPLAEIIDPSRLEMLLNDCEVVINKCQYSVNNVCPNYKCLDMAKKYSLKDYEGIKND